MLCEAIMRRRAYNLQWWIELSLGHRPMEWRLETGWYQLVIGVMRWPTLPPEGMQATYRGFRFRVFVWLPIAWRP